MLEPEALERAGDGAGRSFGTAGGWRDFHQAPFPCQRALGSPNPQSSLLSRALACSNALGGVG